MLNKLIKFSLHNRLFVITFACSIMVYGVYTITKLPVDVLPDLNRVLFIMIGLGFIHKGRNEIFASVTASALIK